MREERKKGVYRKIEKTDYQRVQCKITGKCNNLKVVYIMCVYTRLRIKMTSIVEEELVGEDGNLSSSYKALFEGERRRTRGRREGGGPRDRLSRSTLFSLQRLFRGGQFLFLLLLLFGLLLLLSLLQSCKNAQSHKNRHKTMIYRPSNLNNA